MDQSLFLGEGWKKGKKAETDRGTDGGKVRLQMQFSCHVAFGFWAGFPRGGRLLSGHSRIKMYLKQSPTII